MSDQSQSQPVASNDPTTAPQATEQKPTTEQSEETTELGVQPLEERIAPRMVLD